MGTTLVAPYEIAPYEIAPYEIAPYVTVVELQQQRLHEMQPLSPLQARNIVSYNVANQVH